MAPEMIPEVGWRVLTLDLSPLGVVRKVWPDARTVPDDVLENTSITPDVNAEPLAEPGLMLVRCDDHELFIPFGTIERAEPGRVILGVPARDVDKQPWANRPWRLAA